ncbi:MAG: sensor histidine kinase [Verrucomicrobiaceae bacterium]|jgi:signal transduction histidine kinase|nr:sensor histidine kinase [Verrucomicrobiaceae bacterium]
MSSDTKPAKSDDRLTFAWVIIAFAILPVVTAADYLTGFEFQFSIFYLVSIYLATWRGGWRLGVVVSLVSVVFSLTGDIASGAVYKTALVPWWNCLIALSFYLAMVWSLQRLHTFQRHLEKRVEERTAALRDEIQERKKLEQALLEVSEREQRRIGHDLHDSLCQHLTSAALAGQVLCDKLRAQDVKEAADCQQLVGIVEEGIDLARSLARGLAPVELDVLGLTATLRELARTTTQRSKMSCVFEMPQEVILVDTEAVVHLFRIAQEAVNNAVRHSAATTITIALHNTLEGVEMLVDDDGSGIPPATMRKSGMGLHIMRHRASMMGARFEITALKKGSRVRVVLPGSPATSQLHQP